MPVTSQLTVRMSDDLRAQLERATVRRQKSKPALKWNLTEEVLARLTWSFRKEREERRDRTARALGYLISYIAGQAWFPPPLPGQPPQSWLHDPFRFRMFKLAVAKVLGALEPPGELRPPFGEPKSDNVVYEIYKTPESAADHLAARVLQQLSHPWRLTQTQETTLRADDLGERLVEFVEDNFYAFSDVRRDLGIKEKKESKS